MDRDETDPPRSHEQRSRAARTEAPAAAFDARDEASAARPAARAAAAARPVPGAAAPRDPSAAGLGGVLAPAAAQLAAAERSWPARPLLVLGLALALAGALGTSAALHGRADRALALGCALAIALALVPARLRAALREGGAAGWIAWAALLALLRASALPLPPVREPRTSTAALETTSSPQRAAAREGTYAELGRRGARALLLPLAEPRAAGAPAPPPPDEWLELDGPLARAGERVALLAGAARAPLARGPHAPSQGASRRPAALVRARPDELVRVAPAPSRPMDGILAPFAQRLARARRWTEVRVDGLAARLPPGCARAIVLGDASELEPELRDLFLRTGTIHLLAVSGQHLVLLALVCLGPLGHAAERALRTLGFGRRSALACVCALRIALVALYVPIAGGEAPVRRAAVALALAWSAPLLPPDGDARRAAGHTAPGARGWRADALSLWGFALALECLLAPDAPLQLSVQLSYAATLGLVLAARPLAARCERACGLPWSAVDALGRARPPRLRALAQRALALALATLAASTAAVLATLPSVWCAFGELAPVGVLATPLALPSFVALLVACWWGVLLPQAAPELAFEWPLRWMLAALRACDALPGSPWLAPPRPALLLAALSLASLWLALPTRLPNARVARARLRLARLCAFGWALVLLPWSAAPRGLELVLLDAGHGAASLLRAPGLPALIFDAGSRDRPRLASEALAPALARWDPGSAAVVLSHADRDHCSALAWVATRLAPHAWCGELPDEFARALRTRCTRLDLERGRLRLPLVHARASASGPALELELWRALPALGNEGSRALHLRWGRERVLLSGDACAEGLAALLEERWLEPPLRLLSWPHHGAETAHASRLIAAARPREVWMASGREPAMARELARRGMVHSWSGRDGPLVLRLPAARNPGRAAD